MVKFLTRRGFKELTLDAVFFVWLLSFAVTGHVVPTAIEELINPRPPVAAVSQPIDLPALPDHMPMDAPSMDDAPAEA